MFDLNGARSDSVPWKLALSVVARLQSRRDQPSDWYRKHEIK